MRCAGRRYVGVDYREGTARGGKGFGEEVAEVRTLCLRWLWQMDVMDKPSMARG